MAESFEPNLNRHGKRLVTLCADITVYWRGSMFDRADAILAFYKRALELLGKEVRWYETETMSDIQPIDGKVFGMLPLWLKNPKSRRGMQALALLGGEKATDASDHAFFLFYDQENSPAMGVMRLVLPASLLQKAPSGFAALVAELVAPLDFESGHAGYSVNWDSRGEASLEAEKHLRRIAARFAGIDIPEINTTLINMQNYEHSAFKCVNWITLLGTELAARIGPAETVKEKLGPGCSVVDLQGRYLIQAGAVPSIGDKRKREPLPAYHSVGQLLAPFRLLEHAPLFLDDDEATEKWLSRFDD